MASAIKSPSDFLSGVLGARVVVKLNSGSEYRGKRRFGMGENGKDRFSIPPTKKGTLMCLDGYMNIALENTEEYVNGTLRTRYGDAFVRGNNVLLISPL